MSQKAPRQFFQPLAAGAPDPMRELPVRVERMIQFVPPHLDKVRAKVPGMQVGVSADTNRQRLGKLLARTPGYVGVMNYQGAKFATEQAAVDPIVAELSAKGVAFFEDGSLIRSEFESSARGAGLAFGKATSWIDARPSADEISQQLLVLETTARERGAALGTSMAEVLSTPPNGRPALVLNADYRPLSYYPLSLWPWQDVVKAVFLDRVDIIAEYDQYVRSPSFEMRLPSVIALREFVRQDRVPAFTRFNVFLRDGFQCVYCGSPDDLTFDHGKPLLPEC